MTEFSGESCAGGGSCKWGGFSYRSSCCGGPTSAPEAGPAPRVRVESVPQHRMGWLRLSKGAWLHQPLDAQGCEPEHAGIEAPRTVLMQLTLATGELVGEPVGVGRPETGERHHRGGTSRGPVVAVPCNVDEANQQSVVAPEHKRQGCMGGSCPTTSGSTAEPAERPERLGPRETATSGSCSPGSTTRSGERRCRQGRAGPVPPP